jgi:hypothetical protein
MFTRTRVFQREQGRNMKHTSSTNQPFSRASDLEKIEVEGDLVDDDPELSDIASKLEETSSYAINPEFKDALHKDLLQQFIEHHPKETN